MEMCTIETRKGCRWSLEKAAFAFAIYSLVKWTCTLFLGITTFVTGHRLINFAPASNPAVEAHKTKLYAYMSVIMSVAALLFTTLLIIGLKKRKPSLLLTFFIYGIANETISIAAAALLIYTLVLKSQVISAIQYSVFSIFHVIAIIGLVIVFKMYNKLNRGEVKQFAHSKLQEDTTTNTV